MTKPITISIPHDLGRAEARKRIEEGFGQLKAQLGETAAERVQKSWSGDRLDFTAQAMGQTVTGAIDVLDAAVKIEIQLPNVLALLAGKLKGRLQKEGQILLEKK